MQEKVLALYAAGMSQKDISEQIKNLYGVEISPELVSKISERIIPQIVEWQVRPLDETYRLYVCDAGDQFGWEQGDSGYLDRGERKLEALAVRAERTEKPHYQDSVLFCVDGLTGFPEAIGVAFLKAQIQRCIIHQIKSSSRFVSWKDIKAFVANLKSIYGVAIEDEAFAHLLEFKETWGKKYLSGVKS